jgi:hypothetical protein
MDAGSRVTFSFTGTAVRWIGYRDEWSGRAKVYLDGSYKRTVDTYASPTKAQAVLYSVTGLARRTHTLVIEVTGRRSWASQGAWVWVDAFEVDGVPSSSTTSTTSPTSTATPTISTTTQLEQNAAAVVYSGEWYSVDRTWFAAGSAALAMYNSSATLTFTGTGVSWVGYKDAWAGIARVLLDGQVVGEFDTYAAQDTPQPVIYSVEGLAPGTHRLVIQTTGRQNSNSGGAWVWVDAFRVKS